MLYLFCELSWDISCVHLHVSLVTYSVHIPPLGDLFCTHTYALWPILYIRNCLMAYYVNILPHVDLNSVGTTYSWRSLYTSDYMAFFFLYLFHLGGLIYTYIMTTFTYLRWLNLYTYAILETYSVHREVFEGSFCTHTWWAYLTYFIATCAHTSCDLFFTGTFICDLFCMHGIFYCLFCTHTYVCWHFL